VYAYLLPRLTVPEGSTPEAARRRFDREMAVGTWAVPGRELDVSVRDDQEPGAPWWWEGDEEAADSFLTAMGVVLDG
jgi:hypothetical protein